MTMNSNGTPTSAPAIEQTVVVHFSYGSQDLKPLYVLGGMLDATLKESGLGVYAGHRIAVDRSDGFLYMYGADADALFREVMPILHSSPFMQGAKVKLRYGPPGTIAQERAATVDLRCEARGGNA